MATKQADQLILTGATGYLGRYVASALAAEGYQIHALTRTDSIRHVNDDANITYYEVPDDDPQWMNKLEAILPAVAGLVHTAAVSKPDLDTGKGLADLFRANVEFGVLCAELAARLGASWIVNTESFSQFSEGLERAPSSLYAASKNAFNQVMYHYALNENCRILNLVLYDTFGPGDTRPKVLNLLKTLNSTSPALAMSSGLQLMDPVSIDDAAKGFVRAVKTLSADSGDASELVQSYALRGERPSTLRELVDVVEKSRGYKLPLKWGQLEDAPNSIHGFALMPLLPGWTPRDQTTAIEEFIRDDQ